MPEFEAPLRFCLKSPWDPFDFPKKHYSIYHDTVTAITYWDSVHTNQPAAFAELDAWLPLVAKMEIEQKFDDASVKPWLLALGPDAGLAHTIRTMPDICLHVLYIQIWKSPEDLMAPESIKPWAELLKTAAPMACKTRNLTQIFAAKIRQHAPVYDFTLRVLFGAMLGVFGGKQAPFWTRLYLYAVFVVYSPTPDELATFVERHKLVFRICLESYILFSMFQTSMHDYLVDTYQWDRVCENRLSALRAMQRHMTHIATDQHFLVERRRWLDLERELQVLNKLMTPLCFRPVTVNFCDDIIKESLIVWRKHESNEIDLKFDTDLAGKIWETHPFRLIDAETLRPKVCQETFDKYLEARKQFYMEEKLTGAQHLVSGTEKKKHGLYHRNRQEFLEMLSFATLVSQRMHLKWGQIPSEWARSQLEVLTDRGPDAGVYFFCLMCDEIRSRAVVFPNGASQSIAAWGRFHDRVRTDLGTGEHFCHKKPHQVKLMRVCMIGILLSTKNDGCLVLCVDCGTLVKLTRDCVSPRGPTCGCRMRQTQKQPLTGESHTCDACGIDLHSRSRTQNFRVFDEEAGEIATITICEIHHASWIGRYNYRFPKQEVIQAIRRNKYARMIHGSPVYYRRRVRRV